MGMATTADTWALQGLQPLGPQGFKKGYTRLLYNNHQVRKKYIFPS